MHSERMTCLSLDGLEVQTTEIELKSLILAQIER